MQTQPQAKTGLQQFSPPAKLSLYVSLALLIVLILALHSYHFAGRNYREDEIITAHASTFRSVQDVVIWMALDIHPPLWRVIGVQWAAAFGQTEPITRFLSTLFTAVTLALVYRLAADLFGRRVGVVSVFLLGTLAFFQFYSHEFRPYPALMTAVAASQLFFLRWLRRQNFRYALLYVTAAMAIIYIHYFGLFVIPAQVLVFLIVTRPRRGMYLRAFGLFALVGLSFVPWVLPFLRTILVIRPEGVPYAHDSDFGALIGLHEDLQMRPHGVGAFLLLASLVLPVSAWLRASPQQTQRERDLFRFGPSWRKWYVALFPIMLLLLAFSANLRVGSVTDRNLSVIVPSLAVLWALALSAFPRRLTWLLLALILIPAVTEPESFRNNAPYRETLSFVQADHHPGDVFLLNVGEGWWQHDVYRDYLVDRLPGASPADFIRIDRPDAALGETFEGIYAENALWLDERLAAARHVWYVGTVEREPFVERYLTRIRADYVVADQDVFSAATHAPYSVIGFQRVPFHENGFNFGETIKMRAWSLRAEVQVEPCQTVAVESWWQTDSPLRDNYSLTLVLADASGSGITQTDGTPADVLTGLWQAQHVYRDQRELVIPCDLLPGEYLLLVGMYDFATLASLPITQFNGDVVGERAYLTSLVIE